MSRPLRTLSRAALALAVASTLAACENENALDENLITIESLSDHFSLNVRGLDNMSGGVQYFFAMTGTQAEIDMTQALTSGSAIVQIRDGAGKVQYQEDARDAVDSVTAPGTQGFWQINIVLTKATGEFSFTVGRVEQTS